MQGTCSQLWGNYLPVVFNLYLICSSLSPFFSLALSSSLSHSLSLSFSPLSRSLSLSLFSLALFLSPSRSLYALSRSLSLSLFSLSPSLSPSRSPSRSLFLSVFFSLPLSLSFLDYSLLTAWQSHYVGLRPWLMANTHTASCSCHIFIWAPGMKTGGWCCFCCEVWPVMAEWQMVLKTREYMTTEGKLRRSLTCLLKKLSPAHLWLIKGLNNRNASQCRR